MVDFSKLLNETEEERNERRLQAERAILQNELKKTAEASPFRESFVLSEDPSIRYDRSGFPYALLRLENDSKFDSAIVEPFPGEEDRTFIKRVESLSAGDSVVADGDVKDRNWKDGDGKWHSRKEFAVGIPVSPESFVPTLPDGVSMPLSRYQENQANAQKIAMLERQKAAGLGM